MRRAPLLAILAFLLSAHTLLAQDEGSKLTIPSSPAFSILNFEPTAVMRPTTNKDLAADVLNAFDKDGKLLLNLGLEVTPYWLQSRPRLTEDKYLHPDPGQAFLQSFSLSAATVKDSAAGNNKLGAGFRFKLFNGHPVDSLQLVKADLHNEETIIGVLQTTNDFVDDSEITTKQQAIDQVLNDLQKAKVPSALIQEVRQEIAAVQAQYGDTRPDIMAMLQLLRSNRVAANKELIQRVAVLTYQRKGFILEFAGASSFITSDKNELDRIGVWANASNYVSPTDLFTLTARYMYHHTDTMLSNFDLGIGYLKQGNQYNISVEAMLRWYRSEFSDVNLVGEKINRVERDFTYRLAVQGSYIITHDISINLSLGKDFSAPTVSGSGFFSILGFNYSLFNEERVQLK